jgi:hypothetical protein
MLRLIILGVKSKNSNSPIAKFSELKFSYCEILRKPFCHWMVNSTRKKYQLYNKSYKNLLDYLDISKIVHRLEEVEKFKYATLNKEQFAMFQFISKDICSIEEKVVLKN